MKNRERDDRWRRLRRQLTTAALMISWSLTINIEYELVVEFDPTSRSEEAVFLRARTSPGARVNPN